MWSPKLKLLPHDVVNKLKMLIITELFESSTQGFVGITSDDKIVKISKEVDFCIENEIYTMRQFPRLRDNLGENFPKLLETRVFSDLVLTHVWSGWKDDSMVLNQKYMSVKTKNENAGSVAIPIRSKAIFVERIIGENLATFLKHNRNSQVAWAVLEQLLYVICEAYEQIGFVHGDLHDENVIVRSTADFEKSFYVGCVVRTVKTMGFTPCLIDFGHSHVRGSNQSICHPMSFSQPSVILRGTQQEDFRFIITHVERFTRSKWENNPQRFKWADELIGRGGRVDSVSLLTEDIMYALDFSSPRPASSHLADHAYKYAELLSLFCTYPEKSFDDELAEKINIPPVAPKSVAVASKRFSKQWQKLCIAPLVENEILLVSLFRDIVESMVIEKTTKCVEHMYDIICTRLEDWFGCHVAEAAILNLDEQELYDALVLLSEQLQPFAESAYHNIYAKCKMYAKRVAVDDIANLIENAKVLDVMPKCVKKKGKKCKNTPKKHGWN